MDGFDIPPLTATPRIRGENTRASGIGSSLAKKPAEERTELWHKNICAEKGENEGRIEGGRHTLISDGEARWGRRTGGARGTGRNEEREGGDGRGRWMPDG